jgi:hypothetical protein
MPKNVFILALTDLQRRELETVHGIGDVTFHGLSDVDTLIEPKELHFDRILEQCREELKRFDGSVDGIVAHWDFPTSVLAPILCREYNLPSPSLESILKCEHKYWSRLEQKRSIPEVVPGFSIFDPFDDNPLDQIKLDYPFWIKPVKSFASQLGFMIEDADQFNEALEKIRKRIRHFSEPFSEAMAHANVPDEIKAANGSTCIAEEIISGIQSAPEGSVFNGELKVHGTFDMLKDKAGKSFERLVYPSILPVDVQQRMNDACERFLKHIGFDNGCFNAEFMWDEETDKLLVIEFNTRISQSHSEMFIKVDGESNHRVAVDVALGAKPEMPRGEGPFAVAAKCLINHYGEDAILTRVPDKEELEALKQRYPGTEFVIEVEPGDRLSDIPNQDAYAYHFGDIYLGGESDQDLLRKFRDCLDSLRFETRPLDENSAQTVEPEDDALAPAEFP